MLKTVAEIYTRSFVTIVLTVIVLSTLSAILLATGSPPRLTAVDPATATTVVVAALMVFAVAAPLVALLIWRRRRRATFAVALVLLPGIFVHAASLGEPLVVPGQSLTSLLALGLDAVVTITSIVLAIDNYQQPHPGRSASHP